MKLIAVVMAGCALVGCGGGDKPTEPEKAPIVQVAVVTPIADAMPIDARVDAAPDAPPDAPPTAAERRAEAKRLAAEKRQQAADEAAAKKAAAKDLASLAARQGFVEQLAGEIASNGYKFSFTIGSPSTTIEMIGNCNDKVLTILEGMVAQNMRNVGFTVLACANGAASHNL